MSKTSNNRLYEVQDGTAQVFQAESSTVSSQHQDASKSKKTSVAYFDTDSVASPRIEITNGNIVIQHEAMGGGVIKNTGLIGSGGRYNFGSPGAKKVNPGTYDHHANGTIYHQGVIKSIIIYE